MRGNLPNREPQMQAAWEEMDIYKQVQERTAGRPSFILHDGPPYANGVNGNLRLVLSVIQRFNNRGEFVDDLFQVGCIGLMKAIDNFDLGQNLVWLA